MPSDLSKPADLCPSRVGDSPIAGAGSYVDQEVGGAAATGDGDVILRFLTSYQAVENLRRGMSPAESAREALRRVQAKFPEAQVGLVVLDAQGKSGKSCPQSPPLTVVPRGSLHRSGGRIPIHAGQ